MYISSMSYIHYSTWASSDLAWLCTYWICQVYDSLITVAVNDNEV